MAVLGLDDSAAVRVLVAVLLPFRRIVLTPVDGADRRKVQLSDVRVTDEDCPPIMPSLQSPRVARRAGQTLRDLGPLQRLLVAA